MIAKRGNMFRLKTTFDINAPQTNKCRSYKSDGQTICVGKRIHMRWSCPYQVVLCGEGRRIEEFKQIIDCPQNEI